MTKTPSINQKKHALYLKLSEVTGRSIGVIKQFFSDNKFSVLEKADRDYYIRQSSLIKQRIQKENT
jgi:hypothetical protein